MQTKEWDFKVAAGGHMPGQVHRELDDLIRGLAGKRMTLKLAEYRKKRSNNQNRYMHGVVVKMIADGFRDAGNAVDQDQVFEFLKNEVWKLKQVYVSKEGEVMYGPGSTRLWTTQECEVRLEQARAWAAEHMGIAIPLPSEDLQS